MGRRDDYFTALITNHHVIPSLEDAMSSRIAFEKVPAIKLCNVIVRGPDNFITSPLEMVKLIVQLYICKSRKSLLPSSCNLMIITFATVGKHVLILLKDEVWRLSVHKYICTSYSLVSQL